MANWLSIQAAAEKYGVTEGVIREWIRLNYLTISSLKRDPFEDLDPLVDADELDRALELKSMQSYPDDETIERIPRGHLDWIYQENSRLAKKNDDLRSAQYQPSQLRISSWMVYPKSAVHWKGVPPVYPSRTYQELSVPPLKSAYAEQLPYTVAPNRYG